MAVATEDELYFAAMSDRAGAAIDELYYLNDTVTIPAVHTIIDIFDGVELKPNNQAALVVAADRIQEATRSFIAGSDGTELAAVDPLWDPDAEPAVTDAPADDAPGPRGPRRVTELAIPTTADPAGASGPDGGDPPATADDSAAGAPPTPEPVSAPVGRSAVDTPPPVPVQQYDVFRRPPWRAPSPHGFVKVPCGKCHTQQQAWWQKDTHKGTADPLRNGDDDAARIASLYGIDPADMAKGNQTCMWCHGTIVAAPTRKVRPGVGCQRCHGAGLDYLEPHETESYEQSVGKGLADLKTPAVRAQTCAGCHYITDPGLLAAGHETGADFDILGRMNEIRHWGPDFGRETAEMDGAALSAAYAAVVEVRGPPPEVEPIRPPETTGAVDAPSDGVRAVAVETPLSVVAPATGGGADARAARCEK